MSNAKRGPAPALKRSKQPAVPPISAIAKPEVRVMRLADLKPAPYNPRKISKEAMNGLTESLKKFGLVQPIVFNRRTGFVVGGHQRVAALMQQGETSAQCTVVDLSESDEMALNITLNNPHIAGEFTDDLQALLDQLHTATPDLIEPLNLNDLWNGSVFAQGKTDPDEVPATPETPRSKRGDLYVMGAHRLLCGDSTNDEDVKTLMGNDRAVLFNSDPPYGISYVKNAKSKHQSRAFEDIENDELDGERLQAFIEKAIKCAVPFIEKTTAFYLWHPMLTQGTFFAAAAAAADILIHRQIIWVKPSLVFGRGDYHWRHELCFYGWMKGNRPPFYGERNQTTIWQVGRENDKLHPTQKPVALFEVPISNHTKPGQIIYEPFSGSGSQLIAAEMSDRRCYGLEISPAYCDVIVRRWENFTGKKATIENV